MTISLRVLVTAILPLVLFACANDDTVLYKPPPGLSPATAASLRVGTVDTGFLFFGNTRISVTEIDGMRRVGDPDLPIPVAPGAHAILVRAFRDPVAAFACVRADLAAGKTYVVHATKPEMDTTTIWLEESATGTVVSEKFAARMIRDPILWGPGLKALLVDPVPTSC